MSYLDAVGKCRRGDDREKSASLPEPERPERTLLGHWRQQHLKGTAFRSRFLLDLAHVLGVGNDTFEDAQPRSLWTISRPRKKTVT